MSPQITQGLKITIFNPILCFLCLLPSLKTGETYNYSCMSDALLLTKLYVPHPRPNLVLGPFGDAARGYSESTRRDAPLVLGAMVSKDRECVPHCPSRWGLCGGFCKSWESIRDFQPNRRMLVQASPRGCCAIPGMLRCHKGMNS